MKIPLVLTTLLALIASSLAAPQPANGRTLKEINVSKRVLQRSISPWFYQSLLISPIEGG